MGLISVGLMWAGREADNSPPSSDKVKNGRAKPPFARKSPRHSTYLINYVILRPVFTSRKIPGTPIVLLEGLGKLKY
jgi:hypothetical protein